MKANYIIRNKIEDTRVEFTETSYYEESLPFKKCMQLARIMEANKKIKGRAILELKFTLKGLKMIKISEIIKTNIL